MSVEAVQLAQAVPLSLVRSGLPQGPRTPATSRAVALTRRPLSFLRRCQKHFEDAVTDAQRIAWSAADYTTTRRDIMLSNQLIVVALTATALAAAGCGSTSKPGATGTSTVASTTTASATTATATTTATSIKPTTPAESILIAKAGAICKRIMARHNLVRLATKQDFVREIPPFAAYQQAALTELSDLAPPASIAHEWKAFAASTRLLANDTTRLGQELKVYHIPTVEKTMAQVNKDELNMRALATRYAVVGCERIY